MSTVTQPASPAPIIRIISGIRRLFTRQFWSNQGNQLLSAIRRLFTREFWVNVWKRYVYFWTYFAFPKMDADQFKLRHRIMRWASFGITPLSFVGIGVSLFVFEDAPIIGINFFTWLLTCVGLILIFDAFMMFKQDNWSAWTLLLASLFFVGGGVFASGYANFMIPLFMILSVVLSFVLQPGLWVVVFLLATHIIWFVAAMISKMPGETAITFTPAHIVPSSFLITVIVVLLLVAIRSLLVQRTLRAETAEKRSKESEQQAREAEELTRQTISGVTHAFRQPLNALSGRIEQLLTFDFSNLTPEQALIVGRELVAQQKEITMFKGSVNELLDYQRMEANMELQLNFELSDVRTIIQASVDMVNSLPQMKGKAITVTFDPSLNEEVAIDPQRLRYVLDNLLSNAATYATRNIVVKVRVQGGNLFIDVIDDGKGIAPQHQKEIFELYKQTPEGKKKGGSGIGLAYNLMLMKLFKGDISVKSRLAQGNTSGETTFTVWLPTSVSQN